MDRLNIVMPIKTVRKNRIILRVCFAILRSDMGLILVMHAKSGRAGGQVCGENLSILPLWSPSGFSLEIGGGDLSFDCEISPGAV